MRNSHFTRFLSFVLVVAMLVNILPLRTFAANENSTDASVLSETAEPVTIVGEEVTLRSETEKHFRLSDGSYIAVSYSTPVHFRDEAGNWQDIDNRPVLAAGAGDVSSYQISNANKSTNFSSDLNDGTLFSTSVGDVSVSMQLLDTIQALERSGELNISADATAELIPSGTAPEFQVYSRNAAGVIEESDNTVADSEDKSGWQVDDVMPKNLGASIIYEDVFPGVDLRYEAYSYNIKEEIIIHQVQASYRYDFLLTLNGLTAHMNEDGSVTLENVNNDAIYHIPAPYMVDSAGNMSKDVEYILRETTEGAILTVIADPDWVNSEDRVFPVIIDPSLQLIAATSNNGEDLNMYITFVEENTPTQTAQGVEWPYIGYGDTTKELRGYIYINHLPELPVGSIISQTTLNFYMGSYSQGGAWRIPIGIYELSENSGPANGQSYRDWIRFMDWNTKPSINLDTVIDYNTVSSQTVGKRLSWDITELVRKWYCEKTENRTVAMAIDARKNGAGNNGVATFCAYGSGNSPALIVSYRNSLGIEPYYTYTTLGAGSAGTAYIADATGQLRVVQALLGYSSTVNPYTLSLVYNSDYFASGAATSYQSLSALGLNMSIGSGWRLSCVEKIETEIISNTTYLKYYDGDGTIHYFIPYNNAFYDEDGLGLKIVRTGTNAYEMTDDYGHKWVFTNSFLTSYSDETGNQILIQYASNKLVSIIQKNKNSAEITVASFGYSGNTLSTVTDAAGNQYSFSYDSSNKLTAITKNGTQIAQYGYTNSDGSDNNHQLKQMVDTESGYQIRFQYNSSGKIRQFQELANKETGSTVDISYPNYSQTVYRDYGLEQTNTGDDLLTHYLFDYAGRTANAYTTDIYDNILGASNAVYSGYGSTDKDNNRTMRTASIGVAAQQLLQNPSIESNSTSPWTLDGGMTTSSQAHTGFKGFAGTNGATATYNATDLAAGETYTFSGFVKIPTDNTGVTLEVRNSSNALLASDSVNYVTVSHAQENSQGSWVRISVTFTASTTGTYKLIVKANGGSTVYADDFQL